MSQSCKEFVKLISYQLLVIPVISADSTNKSLDFIPVAYNSAMGFVKTIISFIIVFSFHSISHGDEIRLDIRQEISPSQMEQIQKAMAQSDFILIASEHEKSFEDYVRDITLKMNQLNKDYNCKYWEEDAKLAPTMQIGLHDYETYYKQFYKDTVSMVKMYERIRGEGYMPMQIIPAKLKPLYEAGILSIPIDPLFTDEEWVKAAYDFERDPNFDLYVDLFIHQRNPLFADEMEKGINNGHCKKGILSIGGHHLKDTFQGIPTKPLQDLLKDKGFASQKIQLFDSQQ